MQIINSKIYFNDPEGSLAERAREVGLKVTTHTFHDGPDQYDRLVEQTERTIDRGHVRWRWSDVVDLSELETRVEALETASK